jgi:hypothetical protein
MIVSSEPTAPSRLRSGEDRRGIYPRWPETRPWFIGRQRVHAIRIGTLPVADRHHDCLPPLQTLQSRLVALGADRRKLVPKFSDDAAP